MIPENQLNTAERKVLDAFREGKSGNTKEARKLEEVGEIPAVDLKNQEIRGNFLRGLFCEDCYGEINYRGTIIYKAKVSSAFNMAFYEVKIPVRFNSCRFDEKIQLDGFECPELSFVNCNFQHGLDANQSEIGKDMYLVLCKSIGEVGLSGARIGGQLSCAGARFMNGEGCTLLAHNMKIDGNVLLNGGFVSEGEISLSGARIGGQLNCKGASFMNEQGCALSAHNIKVGGSVLLHEEFKSRGEARLEGAEIGMWLSCSNGNFMNKEGCALFLQGVQVRGNVFLDRNFKTEGSVHLSGAEIGGQLICKDGSFINGEGGALIAQGIRVGDSVIFSERFFTEGEVRLDNAEIGGTLDCTGGTFINKEKNAIIAQNTKINGSVHMNNGFQSEGKVSLTNVEIRGQLNCKNGSFTNEKGYALFAQGLKVSDAVFLSDGFIARGVVHLVGAEIIGELNCTNGNFINERNALGDTFGGALVAISIKVFSDIAIGEKFNAIGEVNLYRAKIDGGLLLEKCRFTGLRLTDAQVGTFSDDEVRYTDSDGSHYDINGFSYQRLEGEWEKKRQVESRLGWLDSMNKGGEFTPQPYEQLMKVYREMGHRDWAREVGFSLEKGHHKNISQEKGFSWWKFWYSVLEVTIGYGYRPFRSFSWFAGLIIIGYLFFGSTLLCTEYKTPVKGWAECEVWRMLPSDAKVLLSDGWRKNHTVIKDYPQFSHFLYAVETALPVLPLGQTDKWHPKSLWLKSVQSLITFFGTSLLAILVFYGAGTLGPRWKE